MFVINDGDSSQVLLLALHPALATFWRKATSADYFVRMSVFMYVCLCVCISEKTASSLSLLGAQYT